jgi:MFS transporter, DHA1 family, staphyloferrin B biosynthesis exporter
VWGVLLGATTPVLMALISKTADSASQGHVLGIAQGTAQFASIAGISLGGLLSQVYGLAYTYLFVCVAYVLALLAILALRSRRVVP